MIYIQRISAFTDEGGRRSLQGCKTTVGIGSLNLVASQKAMDGEDPLKTGMNEGGSSMIKVKYLFKNSFFKLAKE